MYALNQSGFLVLREFRTFPVYLHETLTERSNSRVKRKEPRIVKLFGLPKALAPPSVGNENDMARFFISSVPGTRALEPS